MSELGLVIMGVLVGLPLGVMIALVALPAKRVLGPAYVEPDPCPEPEEGK